MPKNPINMNIKNRISLKSSTLILLSIILLGLSLRLVNIASPILDLYPSRQEQCAMVARNFLRNGFNLFNPQVDWFGHLSSYFSEEFPLISFLAALLYKIFGIHEYLGRLVSILFSIGSIYLLYNLVKLYFDVKIALFSSFCFAVMPLNLYFSRTFMPESTMLFFSIASIYLFSEWLKNNKYIFFIFGVLATVLAFLTKISSLYICLPILFLFYLKYKKKFLLKWELWICFILIIFPVIFWYNRSSLKMSGYIFNPGNLSYLLFKDFYLRLFEVVGLLILTPIGIILFALGFLKRVKNKEQYLFHIWFIAVVSYIFLYPKFNYIHYYYQLPLVPVCAVFMGRALAWISQGGMVKESIFSGILNTRKLLIILVMFFIFFSLVIIKPFYHWNKATYEAGLVINKVSDKNSIIIVGRCTQEAALYYTDRKGWEINEYGLLSYVYTYPHKDYALKNFPTLREIELIKYLISNGANYYLTTNLKAFNSAPELVKYMRANFRVLRETDKYLIFVLN